MFRAQAGVGRIRYPGGVSQAERIVAEKLLEDLPSEERAWLDEQVVTYRELLAYLHDH